MMIGILNLSPDINSRQGMTSADGAEGSRRPGGGKISVASMGWKPHGLPRGDFFPFIDFQMEKSKADG